jgi:DNA-binding response OmpR family regulator
MNAVSAPLRILVVEDHYDTLRTLSRYLRSRGHRVAEAEDVEGARIKLQEGTWDLLFCDKQLPDGDGWSLFAESSNRPVPFYVVAMSAGASHEEVARIASTTDVQYLKKPFILDDVESALKTCHKRAGTRILPHEGQVPG